MISLGCPKNLVDSEVMLGLAQEQGHQLTRDAADADVLIVNTCAFIDKAKQESIDTILEMAEHKKTGACRRLVVTGCMAERYRDELREQIPEIDAILGTGEVPEIVKAIGNGGSKEQDPPYGYQSYASGRGLGLNAVLPAELEDEAADVQHVAILEDATSIEAFVVDERLAAKRRGDVAVATAGNRNRH